MLRNAVFAMAILALSGCLNSEEEAATGSDAVVGDTGACCYSDTSPDVGQGKDASQGDAWYWDDSSGGSSCQDLQTACSAGYICLADISCGETPTERVCTRQREDDQNYYRCQRKCSSAADCEEGFLCKGIVEGDGETDVADVCLSLCLPGDVRVSVPLEECFEMRALHRRIPWPPLP